MIQVITNVFLTFSTKNGWENKTNFLVLFVNRKMILCARFVIYCSKQLLRLGNFNFMYIINESNLKIIFTDIVIYFSKDFFLPLFIISNPNLFNSRYTIIEYFFMYFFMVVKTSTVAQAEVFHIKSVCKIKITDSKETYVM